MRRPLAKVVLAASSLLGIHSFHIFPVSKGLSGHVWSLYEHKRNARFLASSIQLEESTEERQRSSAENEVYSFTRTALEGEMEDRCRALEELDALCSQRRFFSFEHDARNTNSTTILKIPMRIPVAQLDSMSSLASEILENGWMSTNADSVDGLPSFHVNLVTSGNPLFESSPRNTPFQHCIRSMYDSIHPFLDDMLLPYVQKTLNKPDLMVADVFVRHYGAGANQRSTLSSHYDVTSYATVVLALDDSAHTAPNGLYTSKDTSNHAALRRFFPLAQGEGVLHTWNVLHGVDLDPTTASTKNRTSLIVWFSTADHAASTVERDTERVAPWLLDQKASAATEDDGIPAFVLASAMESTEAASGKGDSSAIVDLYLKSAATGNSFAFMRLGTLCEEQALSQEQVETARVILLHHGASSIPELFLVDDPDDWAALAKLFWYLSSLRGNSMAQVAMADQLMFEATSSSSDALEKRTLAATLFVLAAQQGHDAAAESLLRCIDWEANRAATKDEFLQSPVLAVAATCLSSATRTTDSLENSNAVGG